MTHHAPWLVAMISSHWPIQYGPSSRPDTQQIAYFSPGLRGVGKTVLLKEVRNRFLTRGWLATYVQIRPSIPVDRAFAEVALRVSGQLTAGARLARALKSLAKRGGGLQVMGQGATIGAAGGSVDGYRELTEILGKLGQAAREDGVGVALIIDELQALKNAPLGDLMNTVFTLRDEIPLAFVGCGLPYLPAKISKATTSTERLRYEPTDFLVELDARRAVVEPARADGVDWDNTALDRVVELAQGYPYFLQLYASEAWTAANERGEFSLITPDDVRAAVPAVGRQLDIGLYGSRFGKLGPNQREIRVCDGASDAPEIPTPHTHCAIGGCSPPSRQESNAGITRA